MKNIRIGNDINLRWQIRRGGSVENFEGKKVSVFLRDCYGLKCDVDWHTEPDGFVVGTSYGYTQHNLGAYTLTLVENNGEIGMNTVDSIDVWRLVPRQNNVVQGDDERSNLQTEVIELTSDITVGNNITVDTVLSDTSTNPIQNRVVTQALNEKLTENSARESVQNGDWLSVRAGRNNDGNIMDGAVAEGTGTTASAFHSHAEGIVTIASADNAHAEGNASKATGENGHAEGFNTEAKGACSHAEGFKTTVRGDNAHVEGEGSIAEGKSSHAEGGYGSSLGESSHAEGRGATARGYASHAEGLQTHANGNESHAEGCYTHANGYASHAEGCETQANGYASHAEGYKNYDHTNFIHMVGTGNNTQRLNAVATFYNKDDGSERYNGHTFLLNVGGYAGQGIKEGMKSVQEVLAAQEKEIEKLKESTTKEAEAVLTCNPATKVSVDDNETTLTPMRRNVIKGFTNIRVTESPENLVHAELHNFKPTTMYEMFRKCDNLKTLDTSQWDTSEVISMAGIFRNCQSLEQLDLSSWDTGKVTDMGLMFYQCTSLTKLDLRSFDMTGVSSVWGMFYQCLKLSELDLRYFTLSAVTDLSSLFYQCRAFTRLDLSTCNTGAATTMESMFHQCGNLKVLNIASFDLSSVTTCRNMFYQCGSITSLTLGEGFGKMKDSVGTVDFSAMTNWKDSTVQTLTSLYDRKAAGMGVITLKLSAQTRNALGSAGISALTAKGYTIA